MTPGKILRILLARWKFALPVFVLACAAGMTLAWFAPKSFTASATVLVDARTDPVAGVAQIATPNFLATQVDIARSARVGKKVVVRLGLDRDARLQAQFAQSGAQGQFDDWLAARLQKNLLVEPGRGSNVIRIAYTSTDRTFAAQAANAFTNAYLDTVLEMRVEPARRYAEFFDDRARTMRDALERAQARLSAYQAEKGIVATDERLDVENAKLGELSSQLVQLQAQVAESASRQAQAQAAAERAPEVLGSALIAGLKAEAAKQQTRLRELNARLGDNHPQVQELRAGIAETDARIDAETRRVAGSVAMVNTINQQREARARAALEAQRAKVVRLKEARDEMAVLQRDVDNARGAYDSLRQRLMQSSLESQNQQTSISVLNRAEAPGNSPFEMFFKNALKALAASFALAAAVAIAVEFFDRRVRLPEDIALAADLPLIGVMPGPDRRGLSGRVEPTPLRRRLLRQLPRPAGQLARPAGR